METKKNDKLSKTRIVELEKVLREASTFYYLDGNSSLSDQEFDKLKDELEKLDLSNSFLSEIGAHSNSVLQKVEHSIPMGSLKKIDASTAVTQFNTWIKSQNASNLEMHCSWKLDGVSIEVVYNNGKFVQAITRGNGIIGDDVTHTIKNANGLPSVISTKTRISVRCECLLPISVWEKHFSDKKNPRNAAAGLVRRTDAEGSNHLQCIAFDVSDRSFKTEQERINWLKSQGFETVFSNVVSVNDVERTVKKIEDKRNSISYEIDGVVIKINNTAEQEKRGEHDGRPYWARAWKFPAMGGHTTVLGVTWSVGTQGTITPVANVAPVDVGGTTIQNVTLHNLDEIDRLGICIGDVVEVVRAGDVIPQIIRVVKSAETSSKIEISECPACWGEVVRKGPRAVCMSGSECHGVKIRKIEKWIKKRDIKFLGESNISTLIDAYVLTSIVDLYHMTVDNMVGAGLGKRMSEKIKEQIEKSRDCSLSNLIGSLSLDMLGRSEASNLVDHGIDTLTKWESISIEQIESFPGYQKTKATRIVTAVRKNWEIINQLYKELNMTESEVSKKVSEGSYVICLTGAMSRSRNEIVSDIEAAGHAVSSAVNKKTTHLCQADPSSRSSKSKKAESLNIPIISESQLAEILS